MSNKAVQTIPFRSLRKAYPGLWSGTGLMWPTEAPWKMRHDMVRLTNVSTSPHPSLQRRGTEEAALE